MKYIDLRDNRCLPRYLHNHHSTHIWLRTSRRQNIQGPNDILVKLNCTGLCYSDVHFMSEDMGTPTMTAFGVRSPGHEGAGVVVKTGDNVTNFSIGDRVGIKPLMNVCRSCYLCWEGKENYCRKTVHTGLMVTGT